MTKDEHIVKHKELHDSLDILVADMITHTEMFPSQITVLELITWSAAQTLDPTTKEPHDA